MTDHAPTVDVFGTSTQPKFTEDFESRHNYEPNHADAPESGPKRHSTLKKNSLSRNASKRSTAGSIHSNGIGDGDPENRNSFYYTPVPTKGTPTEVLVNRFSAWRRVLKDFISYFKEVQAQYEARARGVTKITHSLNAAANPTGPSEFCPTGGILETNNVLRDFHKEAFSNNESAAKIETEVISNLIALRSDLKLKISEIKGLSGDFKNNLEKEKEATKKEVARLQEALQALDSNPSAGKDPYITRLAVEKQLRKYLSEENYLHRAYLNLESSGRELEKIVVSEIQKAYDAYVKILAREGQELLDMSDRITTTTLRLPTDYEWTSFLERDSGLVSPSVKLRTFETIEYPGYQHPAVSEVRSGMLERKSKYLKSFTGGYYVLSPTHLHEFKTADRARDQTPVMSLYLPDSSLGKHSDPAAVSHKFVLKGRQTGAMHRGHSWVFRAESHATMLEWYEAIKKLTEVSGAERNAYVESATAHKRQASTASNKLEKADTYSENSLDNDEADAIPYSAQPSVLEGQQYDNADLDPPKRPEGGRFPSDIQLHRGLEHRTSSADSSASAVAAATALPGSSYPGYGYGAEPQAGQGEQPTQAFGQSIYDHDDVQKQHALDQSYVVVPPFNKTDRSDTPSSWSYSDERQPVETTMVIASGIESANRTETVPIVLSPITTEGRYDSMYGAPPTNQAFGDFDSAASTAGASPLLDEPEQILPPQHTDRHVVFGAPAGAKDYYTREADATASSDALATPPVPNPMTSVAVDSPGPVSGTGTTAEAIPLAGVGAPQTAAQTLERPPSVRGNSKETINTISNLHVPGEYPKRTNKST